MACSPQDSGGREGAAGGSRGGQSKTEPLAQDLATQDLLMSGCHPVSLPCRISSLQWEVEVWGWMDARFAI